MGRARLEVLPIFFRDRLLLTQVEKENTKNPRNYAGAITGRNNDRREVPHLPPKSTGITGSDPHPLSWTSIRKLKKCIGTWCQKILRAPRTRRFSHGILGRPNLDDRTRKQERKNAKRRTIEGKNSSVD